MKKIKLKWNGRVVALAFASIALVMLLSVSYAYFVSKVEGNEDAKATTITAGKMELEYDGTSIVGMENALPGDKKVITFTVRNIGTVTTQYNVDLINVTNGFIKDELVYSIKRNEEEATEETPLPGSDTTLLEGVSIEKDHTDTYELTIEFKETYSEQNYNQGKEFNGLIQINGYKPPEKVKTILGVSYPVIQEEPDFTKGFPNTGTSEEDITKGSGLYKTADDYGGTSYIFRGQVENNYVHFANQDWRILRVNGDGTIRLIKNNSTNSSKYNDYTSDSSTPQHEKVGYTSGGIACTNSAPCEITYDSTSKTFSNPSESQKNSTIKNALEEWYKTNLNDYDEQIAYGLFCNDISYGSGTDDMILADNLYYGAYQRLRSSTTNVTPTLVCPEQVDKNKEPRTYGGLYKSKIGLITADELAMGGFSYNSPYASEQNYLRRSYIYWTASPNNSSRNAYVFSAGSAGNLDYSTARSSWAVVPVINLKTDNLTYSGTGEVGNEIDIQ